MRAAKSVWMTMSAAIVIPLALATIARAQDDAGVPPPEGEPTSVNDFVPAQVMAEGPAEGAQLDQGGQYHQQWVVQGGGAYYSPTLRGHFRAQWLFMQQGGRQFRFWGARIVHLEFNSPLRQIGLSPGDVITRLDGVSVARGMFRQDGGPWQMVQMERHFGRTEVRYIARGTNMVQIGDMMLNGVYPPEFMGTNMIEP